MGHAGDARTGVMAGIDPVRRDGLVRRIDPRVRIIAALVFAVIIVSLVDLVVLALGLLAAVCLMLLANLPPAQTLRRMAAMDSFIVFILLMLPFTVPGDPMFEIAGFTASWQGLTEAVRIALKANAVVLALMALVGSMDSSTLGHSLHRLRVPENLVHLLLFTVRYIEVLQQEYGRLRAAMKVRGFRPRNSLHTLRSFGYLIGMMLVRALERSERILGAMKCRGFSGRIPTLLGSSRLQPGDWVFAGVLCAFCTTLVFLDGFRDAAA